MSSKPEPVVWSRDTGQRMACFDSNQLTITRMPKIRDVAMAMVLLSYFSRHWCTDVHTDVQKYRQSRDNQNFLDQWVTKFFKVWGSACVPLARKSSAINTSRF